MSGFFITVKNGLLDPKHIKAMGGDRNIGTVWLFLWLLDKMTLIDHDKGEGKVLGGKPIKFEEVEADLGMSRRTYARWLAMLEDGGYIETKRTPYGLIITVFRAFKVFNQKTGKKRSDTEGTSVDSDTRLVAHLTPSGGTSNKTRQLDNTVTTERERTPGEVARSFFEKGPEYQVTISWLVQRGVPIQTAEREVDAFIQYWTEPERSGKRLKWEKQETFEVKRRLQKWLSNAKTFSAQKGRPGMVKL